eukprot:2130466-Rhodomonas_salina.3
MRGTENRPPRCCLVPDEERTEREGKSGASGEGAAAGSLRARRGQPWRGARDEGSAGAAERACEANTLQNVAKPMATVFRLRPQPLPPGSLPPGSPPHAHGTRRSRPRSQ